MTTQAISMPSSRRSRMRWVAPLVVALGILAATSWPAPPRMPHNTDKVIHFTSYGLLAAAVAWADRTRSYRRLFLWIGTVSLFGAVDEWHQQFIPGRRLDAFDWIADTAGAVAGSSLVTALVRRRESAA